MTLGTKVLIVDDHAAFRSIARQLVESAGYAVVGEAANAEQAIELSHALQPDVVLLDVVLPDRDGFAVAEALDVAGVRPKVVLISSRDRADFGTRLASAHATGFIQKSDLSRRVLQRFLGPP